MLLTIAPLLSNSERGFVLLLQKFWSSSAALQSENLIHGFYESFFRLRDDKESTKPYISQYTFPIISDLESANEISKRKLGEKVRNQTQFYFFVQDLKASTQRLHSKLPPWTYLTLLHPPKEHFLLGSPSSSSPWTNVEATTKSKNQNYVEARISFFQKPTEEFLFVNSSSQLEKPKHYRMAELILRSQNNFLNPSFSLCLD